eukprot:908137-Prymnesium_polylepis.1
MWTSTHSRTSLTTRCRPRPCARASRATCAAAPPPESAAAEAPLASAERPHRGHGRATRDARRAAVVCSAAGWQPTPWPPDSRIRRWAAHFELLPHPTSHALRTNVRERRGSWNGGQGVDVWRAGARRAGIGYSCSGAHTSYAQGPVAVQSAAYSPPRPGPSSSR